MKGCEKKMGERKILIVRRIWKKFVITAKHLIQRLLIRLRGVRKFTIPAKISEAIEKIYRDCCEVWVRSATDRTLWDTGVQEVIRKNQSSYNMLFNTTPDDYPESSFIPVNTKEINTDLISVNKQLEITEKRELIGERARGKISDQSRFFYEEKYINFCKKLFTLELQVLTKCFTFGKQKQKDEVIELGEPIEARLLT